MKRYLVLENGEVFAGLAFGAPCDTVGELVFTTAEEASTCCYSRRR